MAQIMKYHLDWNGFAWDLQIGVYLSGDMTIDEVRGLEEGCVVVSQGEDTKAHFISQGFGPLNHLYLSGIGDVGDLDPFQSVEVSRCKSRTEREEK